MPNTHQHFANFHNLTSFLHTPLNYSQVLSTTFIKHEHEKLPFLPPTENRFINQLRLLSISSSFDQHFMLYTVQKTIPPDPTCTHVRVFCNNKPFPAATATSTVRSRFLPITTTKSISFSFFVKSKSTSIPTFQLLFATILRPPFCQ